MLQIYGIWLLTFDLLHSILENMAYTWNFIFRVPGSALIGFPKITYHILCKLNINFCALFEGSILPRLRFSPFISNVVPVRRQTDPVLLHVQRHWHHWQYTRTTARPIQPTCGFSFAEMDMATIRHGDAMCRTCVVRENRGKWENLD